MRVWHTLIPFKFALLQGAAEWVKSNRERIAKYSVDEIIKEQEKVNPTMRGIDWAKKYSSISFYICLGLAIVMWICYVLVPTKKDCLLIIAGGAVGNFITSDSSSKALPADITEYLHLSLRDEIKSLRTDVKKDLGMQSKKENLIDKVKNIGDDALKKELLEYINGDSVNKTPK